uniref:BTB domain-containing protein n=1 Tax=Mesocestoides corti TaxID=53468 RepID=A0A5K3F9B8_MESCO
MSAKSDTKYEHLRSCYSKLFDFYQSGKLTNVTLVIGSEENEERVCAHYSICALSNCLRQLMSAQPFSGEHKLCIRVPSSLTSSASDLRHILYLAYNGDFEQGVTLQRYIQLCELFDMPLGITTCALALRDLLIETASVGKLSDEAILGLQALFTDVLSTCKTEEIQHYMIEYFAFQPFTFIHEKCLAKLSLENVVTLLKEGKLWMHDAEGNVFFGQAYVKQFTEFVKKFCEVHKVPEEATLLSVKSVPQKSMFAPLYLLPTASSSFGSHADYFSNYNFSAFPQNHSTHEMHPPDSWKISALKGYVAINWDGRQPLAGLDVTYRNFRTGVEETVTWGGRQEGDHTTFSKPIICQKHCTNYLGKVRRFPQP